MNWEALVELWGFVLCVMYCTTSVATPNTLLQGAGLHFNLGLLLRRHRSGWHCRDPSCSLRSPYSRVRFFEHNVTDFWVNRPVCCKGTEGDILDFAYTDHGFIWACGIWVLCEIGALVYWHSWQRRILNLIVWTYTVLMIFRCSCISLCLCLLAHFLKWVISL